MSSISTLGEEKKKKKERIWLNRKKSLDGEPGDLNVGGVSQAVERKAAE